MQIYFVSRHKGAIEFLQHQIAGMLGPQGGCCPKVVAHVDGLNLMPGDWVCGVLPLWLAARLCQAGAVALSIEMDLPAHLRGAELSAHQMQEVGARLVRYDVVASGEVVSPSQMRLFG